MSDDRRNSGNPDRSRVAGGEDYEVRDFADRHGISIEQTRDLIARHGNDRATLDREAGRLAR